MSKVFISSVIEGFEVFRHAAKEAVKAADMTPIMIENLSAQPHSSEQACIKGVQDADLVVLILGERYGYVSNGSKISVTHSEYREAIKMHKPVLAFIQSTDKKEDKQQDFVKEVEGYRSGLFRKTFSSPDELKFQIDAALSDWKKSQTSNDETSFLQRIDKASSEYHLMGHQ